MDAYKGIHACYLYYVLCMGIVWLRNIEKREELLAYVGNVYTFPSTKMDVFHFAFFCYIVPVLNIARVIVNFVRDMRFPFSLVK